MCRVLNIVIILQASPEHASRLKQKEFQTEVLSTLMEHLLAADALLGDQAALPVASGGNYTQTANNIFYFTQRVVDKLWQGKNITSFVLYHSSAVNF